jgi:hypothetical protein
VLALQALAVLAGAVQAVVVTVQAASRTRHDTLDGLFYGLGAFFVGALAFLALVVAAVVAALNAGLRDKPWRRHVGVLIGLAIVEIVLLVPATAIAVGALSDPVEPAIAAVPTVVTLAGLAAFVLGVLPATRAWAGGPRHPVPPGPPWYPPGPGQLPAGYPPPGPWPAP